MRVFQVHFSGKGCNKREPEPTEESNYWFLRKPGFTGGSKRHESRNFGEVRNGNSFGPAGTEDLFWNNQSCALNILCISV